MPTAVEMKKYLEGLATEAGLTGVEKDNFVRFGENEKVAAALARDTKRQDEFSRAMDELDKQKKGVQGDFNQWKEQYYNTEVLPRWNKLNEEKQAAEAEALRYKAEAGAYRAAYGTLEGFEPSKAAGGEGKGNAPANGNGWAIDQKRYEQDMQTNRMIAGLSGREFGLAATKYMKEFGDVLDVDAFDKFVGEGKYLNGVDVNEAPKAFRRAYDDFVRPKMEEKMKVQNETTIQQRIKEGVDAELAKRTANMPYDTAPPSGRHSAFFQPNAEEQADARLNDPNTPAYVKEEILRQDFVKGIGTNFNPANLFKG